MERAGSTGPALSLNERVLCGGFMVPFCLELTYFFLQVHFSDVLLQPTHTPFLIAMPQVLHGSHPQVWHMGTSFSQRCAPWPLHDLSTLNDINQHHHDCDDQENVNESSHRVR